MKITLKNSTLTFAKSLSIQPYETSGSNYAFTGFAHAITNGFTDCEVKKYKVTGINEVTFSTSLHGFSSRCTYVLLKDDGNGNLVCVGSSPKENTGSSYTYTVNVSYADEIWINTYVNDSNPTTLLNTEGITVLNRVYDLSNNYNTGYVDNTGTPQSNTSRRYWTFDVTSINSATIGSSMMNTDVKSYVLVHNDNTTTSVNYSSSNPQEGGVCMFENVDLSDVKTVYINGGAYAPCVLFTTPSE